MTTTGSTDKADIDRAIAGMIAEQTAHGASAEQIEMLRLQLKVIADDEDAKLTDKQIPD
jgi:hypothetical protein